MVLSEANPKLIDKLASSPFARLLQRRGRLGICAKCGHLGRFEESGVGSTASPPVIARLHPLPTRPVFSPRDDNLQSVAFTAGEPGKKQHSSSSAQRRASAPKQIVSEKIPPPPPVFNEEHSSKKP
ncbi:MAG: hypothetical protein ACWGMZ_10620 [Thermoguttaceae bacterium]